MTFITVINILLYAKFFQSKNSANAKQYFLLQTVLPITAVKRVGYWLVKIRIHLVVRIQEIQFDTSNVDTPHVCVNQIIHIRHVNNQRITVGIQLTLNGQGIEVLRLIVGYLLPVHTERLLEISVPVKEAYSAHINITVGSFFQIIAGKHSKSARIYLKHLVNAVFHAEVSNGRTFLVRLYIHVFSELRIYILHIFHYGFVTHYFLLAVIA